MLERRSREHHFLERVQVMLDALQLFFLRHCGLLTGAFVLLGIQPESTDWGVCLSPVVNAALNGLVDAALAQIARWLAETKEHTGQTDHGGV